ncbi:hypothetical protein GXP70_09800 [Paenibacillus lycopersici]|uniref:BIG2 domain-containing protein n=1 Tax=Paenibacillus lycopersici TaxID=2704462 RepID=A0A6C0G5A9_9BACL|nr:hypothetical protein [Paenibacillus lycopersici]QHT60205.1 hypothetical protein GXP70_09800 [Paenibacillus lycopersici]
MKRITGLWLAMMIATTLFGGVSFAEQHTVKASVTGSSTYVDGKPNSGYGFNIAGSNYYKLRDIARYFSGTASQFALSWNHTSHAIEITTGKPYTPERNERDTYYYSGRTYMATLSTAKLLINGKPQSIVAYTVDNNTYFQLRDLADKIPFEIAYDPAADRISMFSRTPDNAYRAKTETGASGNEVSSYFPRWRSTVTSYAVSNGDGTISAIEAGAAVTIETYNAGYGRIAAKKIKNELPLFGGFYSGAAYNYLAFGQENREENDDKEVIRIVRYDKSWNRVDSVSVKGGESYTIVPFDAGSGRFAENGNTLVFHTARTRYTTEDGLNHQSQLTIIVNTSNMAVTNDLGRFQANHVSHSFDQYVQFDGGEHVLIDHGDAYPRSVVLQKGDGKNYDAVDLFTIPGSIGANATGVSVGGFEQSASNYIVAMNTVNHALVQTYTSYEMVGLAVDQRDIVLCVLPKNSMTASAVKRLTVAKYVGSDKIASIPKLVKIADDKLMVLWQEFDMAGNAGAVKYAYVDGNGNTAGAIQTLPNFKLSEANPIVSGGKVVWYTDSNGTRIFYSIPLK